MAQDFGGRGRPAWRPGRRMDYLRDLGGRVGLVGGFLIFASLPAMLAVSGMQPAPPPKASGGIDCRRISRAEFLRGWRDPPRTIHYQGIAFARRRGDAECGTGHDGLFGRGFPACEFSAPVALGVTLGGRDAYFAVGPGYTAVVEARPEGVRCVVLGVNRL